MYSNEAGCSFFSEAWSIFLLCFLCHMLVQLMLLHPNSMCVHVHLGPVAITCLDHIDMCDTQLNLEMTRLPYRWLHFEPALLHL